MKRIIAMLLACVMLVGMLPIQAFATEDTTPDTDNSIVDVVDDNGDTGSAEEPEEESSETPAETPEETPDETPVETPDETPAEDPAGESEEEPEEEEAGDDVEIDPAEPVEITLAVSVDGLLAASDFGNPVAGKKLTAYDTDLNGTVTVAEAVEYAHELYCAGGYAVDAGVVTKLWGVEDGCYAFLLNGAAADLTDALTEGDALVASVNGVYERVAEFDKDEAEILVDESVILTLYGDLTGGPAPISGATVVEWTEEGPITLGTTDELGRVTVSFGTRGTHYVTAVGTASDTVATLDEEGNASSADVTCTLVGAICTVTVNKVETASAPVLRSVAAANAVATASETGGLLSDLQLGTTGIITNTTITTNLISGFESDTYTYDSAAVYSTVQFMLVNATLTEEAASAGYSIKLYNYSSDATKDLTSGTTAWTSISKSLESVKFDVQVGKNDDSGTWTAEQTYTVNVKKKILLRGMYEINGYNTALQTTDGANLATEDHVTYMVSSDYDGDIVGVFYAYGAYLSINGSEPVLTDASSSAKITFTPEYDEDNKCEVTVKATYEGLEDVTKTYYLQKESADQIYSGTCGDNVTWKLQYGVLTISGTGAMYDYSKNTANGAVLVPWTNYADKIQSVVIESGVTNVGSYAFYNYTCGMLTTLTSATIADTVTSIGDYAFYGTGLTEVTLPKALTTIGQYAFGYAQSLQSITLPETVTSIGTGAFRNTAFTTIAIPEGIETIAIGTFFNCASLTTINLPSTLKTVEKNTFKGCTALTTVNYNGTEAQWNAIDISTTGNDPLTSATKNFKTSEETTSGSCGTEGAEDSVTWSLGDDGTLTISGTGAMADYTAENPAPWNGYADKITQVVIESSVTTIGDYALNGCTNVRSITIPDSVTAFGEASLAGTAITSIALPATVEAKALQNCTSLITVTLSDGMTVIPESLFSGCTALASITIPETVTKIEDSAFSSTALTTVTIPAAVTEIGAAFTGCTSLTSVVLPANIKTISADAFSSTALTDIYYKGLDAWWTNIGYTPAEGVTVHTCYEPVADDSMITVQPQDAALVKDAETVAPLTISVERDDGETVLFQWYHSTVNSTTSGAAVDAASTTKSSSSCKPDVSAIGNSYYYCVIYKGGTDGTVYTATSRVARVAVSSDTATGTGDGTESNPYIIDSLEDLQVLSADVAAGNDQTGIYYKMAADIELPSDWVPLGTSLSSPFSGTLDGGGYTITVAEGGRPLFGYVREATVKNLNIYGKYIPYNGLVQNYEVDYGYDGNYNEGTGGSYAPGCPDTIDIINVTIKSGTNIKGSGFISGYASGGNVVNITGCTVEAGVKIGVNADGTSAGQSKVGSFAGSFNGTITNCVSSADVYGASYVGGIAGYKCQSMGPLTINNCTFKGTVNATGKYVGGIMGGGYFAYSAPNTPLVAIKNCSVSGTVNGVDCVGGILGAEYGVDQTYDAASAGYIQNNSFTGKVNGTSNVGAIVGYYRCLDKFVFIEGNTYSADCGTDKAFGGVHHIDTSAVEYGWHDGVFYFDSSTDYTAEQWQEIYNAIDEPWAGTDRNKKTSIHTNWNRNDDPLGADKDSLAKCDGSTSDPVKTYAEKLEVSGTYKTEYTVGDKLDLTGMIFTVTWSDGTTTTVTEEDVKVIGFDSSKAAKIDLLITYSTVSATVGITVKNPAGTITVTVSVLGDSAHGSSGGTHTLAGGGLTSWVSGATYTVDSNSTVWDVLQKVFSDYGLSCTSEYSSKYGTIYISAVNGLAEFTNGQNSGWMYTVNGTHPEVGVSAKYLNDGDVIVLHYTDDYTKEEGSSGYGNGGTIEAVKEVENLINAIGDVSLKSKSKIEAARAAYNKLTASQKEQVSNYSILVAAEKKLEQLQAAANQQAAQKVIDLIDKIGDNAAEYEDEIKAARKEYDKLTAAQKALVTNYDKLVAAEKQLASDEDVAAAEKVEDLIDAIAKATTQEEKQKAIEAARKAYDALTEAQQKLVANYDDLEAAEIWLTQILNVTHNDIYVSTGDYIENLGTPDVGSIGGEWMVIGLARSGRTVPGVEAYYQKVVDYVNENADENQRLHHAKSTENARIILALTAIGKDVTDVDGHNLLLGLNDMDFVQKQGINGPIWALIALDSGNYPVPEGNVTREKLIQVILDAQLEDGGWAISGTVGDSDMTGMALQALAPYYKTNETVKNAVDDAVRLLSNMQNSDGSYSTFSSGDEMVATSESIAQVIVALTALGIDPASDIRFIKNGNSMIDALCAYYVNGGGFRHLLSGDLDGMATEQGYYALTAYFRFLLNSTSLYDMTDIIDMGGDVEEVVEETTEATEEATEPVEDEGSSGSWWIAVILVLGLGAAGAVVGINRKKIFGKFL